MTLEATSGELDGYNKCRGYGATQYNKSKRQTSISPWEMMSLHPQVNTTQHLQAKNYITLTLPSN